MTISTGAVAAALICGVLAVASSAPASAVSITVPTSGDGAGDAPTPTAAPVPGSSSAAATPAPALTSPPPTPSIGIAPTIDSPGSGTFIGSGSTTVSGTRGAGDQVQVFAGGGSGTPLCIVDADGSSSWQCANVPLPNGPNVALRVVVSGDPARSAEISVTVLGPPSITSSDGRVRSNGLVHGSAYPGAQVSAQVSNGQSCSFTADAQGNWACILSGSSPDGSYTVSASQAGGTGFPSGRSAASSPVGFILDTTAPSAPIVSTPAPNSHLPAGSSTTYSGTGENGGTVTVWAGAPNGSTRLCSIPVTDGQWSCTGQSLSSGTFAISALQQDAAGNTSTASAAFTLHVDAPGAGSGSAAPGAGPPSPGGSNRPTAPATGQNPSPSTPSATPTVPGDAGSPSGGNGTSITPPVATPFTAAVHPVGSVDVLGNWLSAAVLALLALVLLAIPARMLAGSIPSVGAHGSRWRIFGRNQARSEYDQAPAVRAPSSWAVSAAGLIAATALVTFSEPVDSQSAYPRVAVAVLAALIVVGVVALAVPLGVARRMRGLAVTMSFAPYTLLIVAAASGISRVLQLQPALLYGVVIVATVTTGSVLARATVALLQVGALGVLAGAGWLTIGLLPPSDTTAGAFLAEFVNATVLIAIGSAAVLLLPLGNLPGRAIVRWSRGGWLAFAVAVDTVLFAILVPAQNASSGGAGPIIFAVCTIAFAAISASVWLWQRYIAPALS